MDILVVYPSKRKLLLAIAFFSVLLILSIVILLAGGRQSIRGWLPAAASLFMVVLSLVTLYNNKPIVSITDSGLIHGSKLIPFDTIVRIEEGPKRKVIIRTRDLQTNKESKTEIGLSGADGDYHEIFQAINHQVTPRIRAS